VLRLRFASAAVLIPVILGSVYFGGLVFFVAITFALLVAGWEFFDMVRRAGHRPLMLTGLALIVLIAWNTNSPTDWLRPIVTVALIVTLTVGIFRHGEGWLTGWAYTFAGVLYVGWIGSYFILVRALPNGMLWTSYALLIAWATDTGAYLAGTYFGKHGFFTKISPKKTWEGAIGGWFSAVVAALALGIFLDLPIEHRIIFGLGLSIAATIGDLAESLFKRQTGVKDSSNIIPGHGGLLDRIDSLLFAAVFTYYYLIWILRV
jgi:phosphatidate cytidylyltransferase